MGLKDTASDAEVAKAPESSKATVTQSKTFRDGVIYLYQRSDFKKPTWMCRVKVPGGKGYVNRSTGTGDEHKAFKFADDLYNQLLVKSLTGEAPVGKRMGPVIDAYTPQQGWEIEEVPDDTGFSEAAATLILGSRRPILFVEGQRKSLDLAVYRACYPDWTIIPRGSCEEVIHAVITMRANQALTRVTCAGIVDADDYSDEDAEMLRQKGIAILPVSEIENLFLHPDVLRAIIETEGFRDAELEARHAEIIAELLQRANDQARQHAVALRYCRRRIDRTLKKVDLSDADSVEALATAYGEKTSAMDIASLANAALDSIRGAIDRKDVPLLLRWYDDKGLLEVACKAKNTKRSLFEQWIARTLHNGSAPGVSEAIRGILPQVAAS